MRDPLDDAAFTAFVVATGTPLLRTAWLLTGDPRGAEDLVRGTLGTAYAGWPRLAESPDPGADVRRLMVTAYLRGRRARRRGRTIGGRPEPAETETPEPPEPPATRNEATRRSLDRLPASTRTALVLRFGHAPGEAALGEAEVARTMGCRRRTVRAEVAEGLLALRALLGLEQPEAELADRLADLADDLLPGDPLGYADAARARHERRHGRLAVIATLVVLLVAGGVPLASRLVSLAGPPAGAAAPQPSGSSARPPGPPPVLPAVVPVDRSPAATELVDRLGVAGATYGFLQNCLIGSGIEIRVHPDGSYTTTPQPGRDAQDAALVESCFDRVSSTVPLSEDARELLLSDWTDTYLCLVVRGWVAAWQPPSDLTLQHGLLAWNPYEGIAPTELAPARAACPVRTY